MIEPLAVTVLDAVLRTGTSGNLVRRESSTLELKESFNWSSKAKYARTFAAFANAKGGYVVFGVKDSPHKPVGMRGSAFESLDDADITQYLNEYFDQEIRIERRVFESGGMQFGVVYVFEAARKPIICRKNAADELKEGDIYYRYRATSRRIRHAELRDIIDDEAKRLHDHLLRTVLQLGKIGVGNAVVLDTQAGTIHAPDGAVIVDQSIIDRVKFIREGRLDQAGEPALNVIANAVPAQVITHEHAVALRTPELMAAFFGGALPGGASARDALEALPYESSSYMPAFFFAREAGLSDAEAAGIVVSSEAGGQTKVHIASHLREGARCAEHGSVKPGASPVSSTRRGYLDKLASGDLDPAAVPDDELGLALEAVTHLSGEALSANRDYVLAALQAWLSRTREYPLKQAFGVAVCSVDEALYRE